MNKRYEEVSHLFCKQLEFKENLTVEFYVKFDDIPIKYHGCINNLMSKAYSDIDTRVLAVRFVTAFDWDYNVKILFNNSRLVGLCLYKYDYRIHDGATAFIDTLVVSDAGLGFGKKLLDEFKGQNIELTCPFLNTNAQGFYDNNRFKRRAISYIRNSGN